MTTQTKYKLMEITWKDITFFWERKDISELDNCKLEEFT